MKPGDQPEDEGSSVFLLRRRNRARSSLPLTTAYPQPSATTRRTIDLASSTDVPRSVDAHPLEPVVLATSSICPAVWAGWALCAFLGGQWRLTH